jgi:hypothetical protein
MATQSLIHLTRLGFRDSACPYRTAAHPPITRVIPPREVCTMRLVSSIDMWHTSRSDNHGILGIKHQAGDREYSMVPSTQTSGLPL